MPLRSLSAMTLMPFSSTREPAGFRRAVVICRPPWGAAGPLRSSQALRQHAGDDGSERAARSRRATATTSSGSSATPVSSRVDAIDRPSSSSPAVAGRDRLDDGRHADQVGAEAAQHRGLGDRSAPTGRAAARRRLRPASGPARGRCARSRGLQASVRSTKCAPTSGETRVRLRWSAISTPVPGGQSARRPPLALVSTATRRPAAAPTRTGCATGRRAVPLVEVGAAEEGEHARGRRGRRSGPARGGPARPARGSPGRSATGELGDGVPRASAAASQPLPSTTTASCRDHAGRAAPARPRPRRVASVLAGRHGRHRSGPRLRADPGPP